MVRCGAVRERWRSPGRDSGCAGKEILCKPGKVERVENTDVCRMHRNLPNRTGAHCRLGVCACECVRAGVEGLPLPPGSPKRGCPTSLRALCSVLRLECACVCARVHACARVCRLWRVPGGGPAAAGPGPKGLSVAAAPLAAGCKQSSFSLSCLAAACSRSPELGAVTRSAPDPGNLAAPGSAPHGHGEGARRQGG